MGVTMRLEVNWNRQKEREEDGGPDKGNIIENAT